LTISVPSLAILVLAVLVLSRGQTDRQTHRITHRRGSSLYSSPYTTLKLERHESRRRIRNDTYSAVFLNVQTVVLRDELVLRDIGVEHARCGLWTRRSRADVRHPVDYCQHCRSPSPLSRRHIATKRSPIAARRSLVGLRNHSDSLPFLLTLCLFAPFNHAPGCIH